MKKESKIQTQCYSRMLSSGIPTLEKQSGGDPRTLRAANSGMTVKGFTLIELLVVVFIIGILAAIAVPQYQKAVTKSRAATLQALLSEVVKASDLYYAHNGEYPKTFDELDVDIGLPTAATPTPCPSFNPTSTKQGDGFEISIYGGANLNYISAHFTTGKYKCRGFMHYNKNDVKPSLEGHTYCGEYYYHLACGSGGCGLGDFCKKIMGKNLKTYAYQIHSF